MQAESKSWINQLRPSVAAVANAIGWSGNPPLAAPFHIVLLELSTHRVVLTEPADTMTDAEKLACAFGGPEIHREIVVDGVDILFPEIAERHGPWIHTEDQVPDPVFIEALAIQTAMLAGKTYPKRVVQ